MVKVAKKAKADPKNVELFANFERDTKGGKSHYYELDEEELKKLGIGFGWPNKLYVKNKDGVVVPTKITITLGTLADKIKKDEK